MTEGVQAAEVAAAELREHLREKLDERGVSYSMTEVDAPHRELWIHDIDSDFEPLLRKWTRQFATQMSAEAGSPLDYRFTVNRYDPDSTHDGYVCHVAGIAFGFESD